MALASRRSLVDLLPRACRHQSQSDSAGATFGGCRSHMIWRLIRSRISEGSRRVARRGLGPASSVSSRTPSPTPSRQPAPATSAKRICVATGRDSANSALLGSQTLSIDLARCAMSVPLLQRRQGGSLVCWWHSDPSQSPMVAETAAAGAWRRVPRASYVASPRPGGWLKVRLVLTS
jgi:hypothetical protein